MQTTRQRILNYLTTHHRAGVPELSQILNLTQANIRHHLNVMEEAGLVEVIGQAEPEGRGRPTLIYMLTRNSQHHALDLLSSALLDETLDTRSAKQHDARLMKLAYKLAGPTNPSAPLTIRLTSAMRHLNDLYYQAHWEAHADAPQVFFGQCPYAQIITQHPELCTMDAFILERLTGVEAIQVEKISRSQQGATHCRFSMQTNNLPGGKPYARK